MQDYTIRPYIPTDFETVTFLWRRSRQQAFPEFLHAKGHTFEEDQAYFRNVIFVNNEVWVAVINEKVVAFMAISGDFIDQLYVDPDHQRRGIGLTLLDEHARRFSPGHLWLYTLQINIGGRSFYEKNGFKAVKFGMSPA